MSLTHRLIHLTTNLNLNELVMIKVMPARHRSIGNTFPDRSPPARTRPENSQFDALLIMSIHVRWRTIDFAVEKNAQLVRLSSRPSNCHSITTDNLLRCL